MPAKRVAGTYKRVSARRALRRRSRYTKRRTSYKARRSGRRSSRRSYKGNSFARRVLDVTSKAQSLIDDQVIQYNSTPGKAAGFIRPPVLDQNFHGLIQAQLNNDTVAPAVNTKSYFLKSMVETQVHQNWSPVKVQLRCYYFKARRDSSQSALVKFNNGFTNDGGQLVDDVAVTPFGSSDFCSFFKITRVVTRWLEQGESYKVVLSRKNLSINPDRYNQSLIVAGSRGCCVIASGDIGLNTTLATGTTGPVSVGVRLHLEAHYSQLADNQVNNNFVNRPDRTGTAATFRYANADQGVATTGAAAGAVL